MERTPESFTAALASGETERVNHAIDAVEGMDAVEQAAIYDDCFDRCLDVYAEGDGYVRQSVVRFLRDAYPMLELEVVFGDESVLEEVPAEEIEAQRARLVEFLLRALEDDDGRVRLAATKGINLVGTAMSLGEYDDELDALVEMLAELEADLPGDERKHVEQARHTVNRQRGLGLFSSSR